MSLPRKLSQTMLKHYQQGILTAGINILTFHNFLQKSVFSVQNTPNGHPGFLFGHVPEPTPFSILKKNLQKETAQHKQVITPSWYWYKLGTENETGLTCWNFPTLPFHQHTLRTHKEPTKKNKSSQHSNHSLPVAKSSHLHYQQLPLKRAFNRLPFWRSTQESWLFRAEVLFKKSTVP